MPADADRTSLPDIDSESLGFPSVWLQPGLRLTTREKKSRLTISSFDLLAV